MRGMLVIAALVWAWLATAAAAAPLQAYGQLPQVEQLDISPNGEMLAMILTDGEERQLVIRQLVDNKVVAAAGVGQAKVRDIAWAGQNNLLITVSRTALINDIIAPRAEWNMAFDFNIKERNLRPLLKDIKEAGLNTIHDRPVVRMLDGKPMVFLTRITFVDHRGVLTVFRADLEAKRVKVDTVGFPDTRDWIVGPDGKVAAQAVYDAKTGRWSLKVKKETGWRDTGPPRRSMSARSSWVSGGMASRC